MGMTTYSPGDRVLVRIGGGASYEAEVIDDRGGSKVKVRRASEDATGTVAFYGLPERVLRERIRPIPVKATARVEPLLPPEPPVGRWSLAGPLEQPFSVYKARAVPKPPKPWRSPAYRAYVREQDECACCGRRGAPEDPIEASHHGPHGMAQKSDDSRVIGLRASCHRYYHQHGHFEHYTREETDARAKDEAAELLSRFCHTAGIDTADTIIAALTAKLRES